jgi:tRNA(Glu) U13 pseudouridine synthase TruD
MHALIQSQAHIAYNVEDINAALEGTKVLLPALDCGNMIIAFIEEEGVAIELIELK